MKQPEGSRATPTPCKKHVMGLQVWASQRRMGAAEGGLQQESSSPEQGRDPRAGESATGSQLVQGSD